MQKLVFFLLENRENLSSVW